MANTQRFAAWFVVSGDATADEIRVTKLWQAAESGSEVLGYRGISPITNRPPP